MAEKIITEYEVVTQKSIENLQAVSNKLRDVEQQAINTRKAEEAAAKKAEEQAKKLNTELEKNAQSYKFLGGEVAKVSTFYDKYNNGANNTISNLKTTINLLKEQLSVTQIGTAEFGKLSTRIIESETRLKQLSGTLKATNVAPQVNNATKSFNGLSNSIGQVSRELPNFALNAQTGFLAISNNLPILFDNLQRVKEENLALAASGQKTTSVFKQVIGSIFSLNTALTLLISLTIIYGKELGIFFKSLFEGGKAFDEAKVRLEALNAAYDSKELKNAIKGVLQLEVNINLAKKGLISQEVVLKQYNETLGISFGKVNDLTAAEKGLQDNTNAYINALIQRASANKILDDAVQTNIELIQKRRELDDEENNRNQSLFQQFREGIAIGQQITDKGIEDAKAKRANAIKEEIKELEDKQKAQIGLISDFNGEANKVLQDNNGVADTAVKSAFELLNEEISKTKLAINNGVLGGANVSADLQKLADLEQKLRVIETTIARLQSPQDLPSAPDITTTLNPIDAKGIEQNVDIAEKELQRLNKLVQKNAKDSIKENEETAKYFAEQEKEKTKVVEEEARKRAQLEAQLREGALGLASTFENELFSLRRNNLQNQTQFELSELEKQRDNKSITEKQFNDRKNAILSDQAQKQRQLDLAEIKVKTALAIISAIARSPETFGLPFSAFAAAEGLIQYAFASSQPLPRFAKGTDRVKGGTKGQDSVLAMLMPDEAVIPAKENLKRPEMAKAWISGDLDRYLTMNYIRPAIEANNKAWEKQVNVDQSSQFIRNDNFNDKRIVKGLDSISRKLNRTEEKVVYKRNRRLWN